AGPCGRGRARKIRQRPHHVDEGLKRVGSPPQVVRIETQTLPRASRRPGQNGRGLRDVLPEGQIRPAIGTPELRGEAADVNGHGAGVEAVREFGEL
ncbi:hypothetical protein HDU98_006085, partial [Podochytrium sp. JEL0797]